MRSTISTSKLLLWSFVILIITIILSDSRLSIFSIATPLKVLFIAALILTNLKEYLTGNIEIPFYKYFFPFFAVAGLSVIAANSEPARLIKTLTYFLSLSLIPLLAYKSYMSFKSQFLKILMYIILGVLILGLLLLLAGYGGVYLVGRYRGLLGNPNGLGMFILFSGIAYFLINHYHHNLLSKRIYWVGWLIIIISLLLSGSRNSLIAFGIFLFFSSKLFRRRRFLQLGITALVIIFFSVLTERGFELIKYFNLQKELRIESMEDIQKGSGRAVAHTFALDYIEENVWFGNGIGTTEKIYKDAAADLSDEGHQGNAHNSFFTVWIDTGLFGLALFCAAWFFIFYQVEMQTGYGFPIMITVIFSAYFESYLASSLNPFTVLLLIILTLLLIPDFITNNELNEDDSYYRSL